VTGTTGAIVTATGRGTGIEIAIGRGTEGNAEDLDHHFTDHRAATTSLTRTPQAATTEPESEKTDMLGKIGGKTGNGIEIEASDREEMIAETTTDLEETEIYSTTGEVVGAEGGIVTGLAGEGETERRVRLHLQRKESLHQT